MWKILRTTACGAMSVALAGSAGAQATDIPSSPWFVGTSLGLPRISGYGTTEFLTLSVHWTQVHPSRPGVDISVGLMPRQLSRQMVPLLARVGIVLPVVLPNDLILLPSAGATVLATARDLGAEVSGGYNAGVAALLPSASRFRLRGGVSVHALGGPENAFWMWELGITRGPRP